MIYLPVRASVSVANRENSGGTAAGPPRSIGRIAHLPEPDGPYDHHLLQPLRAMALYRRSGILSLMPSRLVTIAEVQMHDSRSCALTSTRCASATVRQHDSMAFRRG